MIQFTERQTFTRTHRWQVLLADGTVFSTHNEEKEALERASNLSMSNGGDMFYVTGPSYEVQVDMTDLSTVEPAPEPEPEPEPPLDAQFITTWGNDPVGVVLADGLDPFADGHLLMEANPSFSKFLLQYAGVGTDRLYAMVDSDRWLRMHYKPTSGELARIETKIQQDVSHSDVVKSFTSRLRMKVHPDFALLKESGLGSWTCMFAELKVRPHDTDSFRITMRWVADETHGLAWWIDARTGGGDPNKKVFWRHTNRDFGVPLDRSFIMGIDYQAGDANTGRMLLTADLEDGQPPVTIFDINDWTDRPNMGEIRGVQNWYPFMLYVPNNNDAAQFMADHGAVMEYAIDWWSFDR